MFNPGYSCKVIVCVRRVSNERVVWSWVCCVGGDGPLTLLVFWGSGCACLFQLICSSVCKKLVMLCLRALLLTARRDQLFSVIRLNWSQSWIGVFLSAGWAGEAAAAGQSHPRSLRQRQDSQERQLFPIRKTSRYDRRFAYKSGCECVIYLLSFLCFRANLSESTLMLMDTSSEPILKPVSLWASSYDVVLKNVKRSFFQLKMLNPGR